MNSGLRRGVSPHVRRPFPRVGTRSRECSAPAAADSCAPSSAKGAEHAYLTPRTRGSWCGPRTAETALWRRAKSATAARARSGPRARLPEAKAGPHRPLAPRSGALLPHLVPPCLSGSRSARTPAALPTTALCVRGPSAPKGTAARAAW